MFDFIVSVRLKSLLDRLPIQSDSAINIEFSKDLLSFLSVPQRLDHPWVALWGMSLLNCGFHGLSPFK